MDKQNTIKLLEKRQVRSVWNEETEEWYFSIVDVVGVLTDSINPTDYLKKLRKRDTLLGHYIGTNCPQIAMMTETGKTRSQHCQRCTYETGSRNR
jgi:hypothetical protein